MSNYQVDTTVNEFSSHLFRTKNPLQLFSKYNFGAAPLSDERLELHHVFRIYLFRLHFLVLEEHMELSVPVHFLYTVRTNEDHTNSLMRLLIIRSVFHNISLKCILASLYSLKTMVSKGEKLFRTLFKRLSF